MISKRLLPFSGACLAAAMMWPQPAAAQYHPHPRTSVHVGVGFGYGPYYPFYGPYYPFYTGFGFGWAPYYGYPYFPYAAYGYPYPGYYSGSFASVRLEMKPRTAEVYVDGYLVGNVDSFDGVFQRLDLPAGEHELTIYQAGYRTVKQKNLFRPGEGYHYKAVLEPLPAGAPEEPRPQPANPPPDRHQQDPYGHQQDPSSHHQVDPRDPRRTGDPQDPRDPRRTQDPRDPRDPRQEFGTLNVRVQPADAVIVIDGERWDTPEGGSRLSVQLAGGSHRIEVRKEGFRTYTTTVQIRPGEAQSLNISLQ